jgi:YkoY family integral membrane protein
MLHQTFAPRDLLIVLLLVAMEGLLSIDNALVLGLLARRLPDRQRGKALTYGLIGSLLFRTAAVAAAAWLLEWRVVKLLGGGYLVYVAVRHLVFHRKKRAAAAAAETVSGSRGFWTAVLSIELTDAAFAVDSILAGIALVGPAPDPKSIHPKLWIVVVGGMLGVVLMRFAARGFIWLLNRFPRFETSAYLLVAVVGCKLIADWAFGGPGGRTNFESASRPEFWLFWGSMAAAAAVGFLPGRRAEVESKI